MAEERATRYGLIINKSSDAVELHRVKRTVFYKQDSHTLRGVKFCLPDGESKLIYLPWPKKINVPEFKKEADYHQINVHGLQTQPRKTVCYGESYKYSGTSHELEKYIPQDIKDIMAFTLCMYSEMLDKDKVKMMCLANKYSTGYHCIGKHSD